MGIVELPTNIQRTFIKEMQEPHKLLQRTRKTEESCKEEII